MLAVIPLALIGYILFGALVGRVLGGADDRQEAWELQQVPPPQPVEAQDLVLEADFDLQSVSAHQATA